MKIYCDACECDEDDDGFMYHVSEIFPSTDEDGDTTIHADRVLCKGCVREIFNTIKSYEKPLEDAADYYKMILCSY